MLLLLSLLLLLRMPKLLKRVEEWHATRLPELASLRRYNARLVLQAK
jgi:hypothetical protein